MLYGIMELVKWFVENDMQIWTNEDYEAECKRIREEYVDDEECMKSQLEGFQEQYEDDRRIIGISRWWANYPNRLKEISSATAKWHAYIYSFQKDKDDFFMSFLNAQKNMTEEQKAEELRLLNITGDLENKLNDEEQEMLGLAIELRGRMWS